ncbi:hypothetical protein ACKWTF_005895 [Chironomus riparius]
MNLKTIKFNNIPKDVSILKLFNHLNRQFQIQVNEYKGVGFIKRESAEEDRYNLIVEYRKPYLMRKILDTNKLESAGYKLTIDDYVIYYNVVGMKYVVCEMRNMSNLKDRTLKFKTLESQNVMDLVAKVIGKAKFEIDYLISNKSSSFIAMRRNIDATQLLILLRNQHYEVDWSDVYHEYNYFCTESQNMSQNIVIATNANFSQSHNSRFHPYRRTTRVPEHYDHRQHREYRDHREQSAIQAIKNLESQLLQTNNRLNNLMTERETSLALRNSSIYNNNDVRQQQLTPQIRQLPNLDQLNNVNSYNVSSGNTLQSFPMIQISQPAQRISSFPANFNPVVANNLSSNIPCYYYYPFNV